MLVVGVLLTAGPPATTVGPGDPMNGMAAMEGTAAGAELFVAGAPASDGVPVTACALCVDLLETCLHLNALMPAAIEASFWFLMQVGIVLGLVTGYPAVAWLARRRSPAAPLAA